MKLHTAIRDFTNQYDREAISSIQDLGTKSSIGTSKFLFEGVDIGESTNQFIEFLEGYAKYKMSLNGKPDELPILEKTELFLRDSKETSLPSAFKYIQIRRNELPDVCSSYLESVSRLTDTIDSLTTEMKESDVSNEDISSLTEMGDMYITHLYPKLESIMEYALCASGYKCKQWVNGLLKKKYERKPDPVFV